jgi:hypothetical protein
MLLNPQAFERRLLMLLINTANRGMAANWSYPVEEGQAYIFLPLPRFQKESLLTKRLDRKSFCALAMG